MKKAIFLLIFVLSFVFVPKVFAAEHIVQYTVDLQVQETGDLFVQETILYDFDDLQRHGMYRNIPTEYARNGSKFILDVLDIQVVDEKGQDYEFTTSRQSGELEIKIGDPDTLITGVHEYILKYAVKKPVVFQDQFDRLSWNAIGTEWDIPIDAVDVHITAPKSFENKILKINCYRGVYGVAQTCGFGSVQKTGADFKTTNLGENKGITIDIDLKKGTILPPTQKELLLEQLKKWWPLVLPFITFSVLLYLWYKNGRDPKGRGTIITQFNAPDGLTPAEVGTVLDEEAHNKDIFAEIIYLATKGYLKIFKEEKSGWFGSDDYTLTLLQPTSQVQNVIDQKLLQALFKEYQAPEKLDEKTIQEKSFGTVKLSSLKNKFYKDLQDIQRDLYVDLTSRGYFKSNPSSHRIKYIVAGVVITLFSVYLVQALTDKTGEDFWILVLCCGLCGVLCFAFARAMPARTQKGVDAREHILGLKNYLTVAEKDRIDFHNAPEKNPQTFEKFLPYAMVLGVETAWAKQFADLTIQPSWYGSTTGSAFNAIAFTSGMSNFSSVATSNMASSPSSGGGGSSGGGFGGGGGGSW